MSSAAGGNERRLRRRTAVEHLFRVMDSDGDGAVTKTEFLEFIREHKPDGSTVAQLTAAFGLGHTGSTLDWETFEEIFDRAATAGKGALEPEAFGMLPGPGASPVDQLLGAAATGDQATVEAAIRDGVDVDHVRQRDGACALYLASTEGHLGVVAALLAASTKTLAHQTIGNGKTALLKAAVRGHAGVARALLEAGAPVDQAKTYDNATAVYAAAYAGRLGTLELLIKAGADLEIPLLKSAMVTIKRDAKYYGSTPLHVAAFFDQPEVVTALIDAGANRRALTDAGLTPLEAAESVGAERCVALLMPKWS